MNIKGVEMKLVKIKGDGEFPGDASIVILGPKEDMRWRYILQLIMKESS